MSLIRPLTAVSLAAVLALAGCSGSEGEGEPSESPGAGESASDAPGTESPQPDAEADLEDLPEVVAEVNGEEITLEEFLSSYEGQLQQAAMSQQTTGEQVDEAALQQQVIDQLVGNRLLTQAAAEAGIEATEEDIQATLADIAAQNGLGSADEVIAALGEQGISEEQVREDAASQFEVTAYIDAEAEVTEPSEDELRAQYDTLVEQMEAQGGGEGEGEIPPFEEVRDQLAAQARGQQQNAAVEEILAGLREDGDVTIHL
ncbi:SurA N-terminal domain-containing protein [Ruania alba]|uniref:peptidylprolyl isomerase n=1 Tax=Ruania alba TaxID=648782 RepID=A0A1H5H9D8_9MICO|nr:SurA N-terminal domain-containing protein [Ruania alba]SEE23888.1 peptidyl-prolyl cis-trans isomerase SurA [Ruania alba]